MSKALVCDCYNDAFVLRQVSLSMQFLKWL